jgi:hypothetical protein
MGHYGRQIRNSPPTGQEPRSTPHNHRLRMKSSGRRLRQAARRHRRCHRAPRSALISRARAQMWAAQLAHQAAERLANRRRNKVELTGLGRPGNCRSRLSTNCPFSTVHRGRCSLSLHSSFHTQRTHTDCRPWRRCRNRSPSRVCVCQRNRGAMTPRTGFRSRVGRRVCTGVLGLDGPGTRRGPEHRHEHADVRTTRLSTRAIRQPSAQILLR